MSNDRKHSSFPIVVLVFLFSFARMLVEPCKSYNLAKQYSFCNICLENCSNTCQRFVNLSSYFHSKGSLLFIVIWSFSNSLSLKANTYDRKVHFQMVYFECLGMKISTIK